MTLLLAIVTYLTQALVPGIASLQVRSSEADYVPVISMGGDGQISVEFDALDQDARHYSYDVLHCDRQWQQDDLFTSDYLQGFPTGDLDAGETSINTRQIYTHYELLLPNENMQFTRSGNYVVRIFEDGDREHPVLTARFMLNEGGAKVSGEVTPNTDRELSGRLQQLSLAMNGQELDCQNLAQDVHILVQQNQRLDNQVWLERPSAVTGTALAFEHNPQLIFEGGNEYRRFDISSNYLAGVGVDRVRWDHERNRYQAWLEPLLPRTGPYLSDQDVDGRYVIHTERVDYSELEGDYQEVHLVLQGVPQRLGEVLYLSGEAFGQGALLPQYKLLYDEQRQVYYKDLLLKQGGYNYLVLAQQQTRNGNGVGQAEPVEGSHWQTENQYLVLVYQRSTTDRYDRLVGWALLSSSVKG